MVVNQVAILQTIVPGMEQGGSGGGSGIMGTPSGQLLQVEQVILHQLVLHKVINGGGSSTAPGGC